MSEDESASQPSKTFSYDPAKFETFVENLLGSYRTYREDSAVAFGKMTDMNKEIAAFNEKLMLLSLGTIGLSVSALITFVSRFPLVGAHKIIIIVFASTAWGMLLISASCFRSVIADCMMANKKLLYEWISTMQDVHGSAIKFHSKRVGTAFTGTLVHDGALIDPKEVFAKLAEQTETYFQSAEVQHYKNVLAQIKVQPELTGKVSKSALVLLQVALLLLAITAIVLFAQM